MANLKGKVDASSLKVKKIHRADNIHQAQQIRYEVFVVGQNVPEESELDEFEDESFHFLAFLYDTPCGAARWRFTEKGIKLERFAVLEGQRGCGVGSALLAFVLDDVRKHPEASGKEIYLNAQISAVKLYSNFGFRKSGELFQECDIDHIKMVKQ